MIVLPLIGGFPKIVPGTLTVGHTLGLGGFRTMGLIAKANQPVMKASLAGLVEGLKVVFRPGKLSRKEPEGAGYVKVPDNGQ